VLVNVPNPGRLKLCRRCGRLAFALKCERALKYLIIEAATMTNDTLDHPGKSGFTCLAYIARDNTGPGSCMGIGVSCSHLRMPAAVAKCGVKASHVGDGLASLSGR
jgi:hypothetical protein